MDLTLSEHEFSKKRFESIEQNNNDKTHTQKQFQKELLKSQWLDALHNESFKDGLILSDRDINLPEKLKITTSNLSKNLNNKDALVENAPLNFFKIETSTTKHGFISTLLVNNKNTKISKQVLSELIKNMHVNELKLSPIMNQNAIIVSGGIESETKLPTTLTLKMNTMPKYHYLIVVKGFSIKIYIRDYFSESDIDYSEIIQALLNLLSDAEIKYKIEIIDLSNIRKNHFAIYKNGELKNAC